MDIFTLLLLAHIVGAILGVGGATFIEIFLNKSLLDGYIDPIEGSFMKTTATILRIGLFISITTGLGLILFYRFNDQIFRLYDPLLWAKFTILFVLLINGLLLQARVVKLWLGSSISFVSWYAVFVLGFLASGPAFPYTLILFFYVIAIAFGAVVLHGIRSILKIKL